MTLDSLMTMSHHKVAENHFRRWWHDYAKRFAGQLTAEEMTQRYETALEGFRCAYSLPLPEDTRLEMVEKIAELMKHSADGMLPGNQVVEIITKTGVRRAEG